MASASMTGKVDSPSSIDLQPEGCRDAMNNNIASTTLQENLHSEWLQQQWPDWGEDFMPLINHVPIMHEPSQGNNSPQGFNNSRETQSSDQKWDIMMKKLNNIENNTNSLTRDMASLSDKVDRQSGDLQQIKARSLANEKNISTLSRQQQQQMSEFDHSMQEKFRSLEASLREENSQLKEGINIALSKGEQKIKAEISQEAEAKSLQSQCNARKINLILVGLREDKAKDNMDLAKSFFKDRMATPDIELRTVYRLGKPKGKSPRLLLVKFANMMHRNKIWFAKSKITPEEGNKIWIQEDLPKPLKNVHRTLYRVLKKARSFEGRFPDAQIKGQSLFIDGKPYSVDELEGLPDVLRPSTLATPQSESVVVFFGRFSPLSNHHPSPFLLEGSQFSCMEHYLAWRRATLSGKTNYITRASKPADPIIYKGILNDLRKDHLKEWDQQLGEVVLTGLRAKFQQNPSLGRFLCNTHPKSIGEASLNTKWGIGLTLDNPNVLDSSKWSTEGNLLGKKLSQVRDELLAEKNA